MPALSALRCNRVPFNTYLCILAIILVLLSPLAVFGQGSGRNATGTNGSHVIRGYVFFPSGRRAEGTIQVKLESYNSGELSVIADSSGAFTFGSLSPGSYTVVVIAGDDYEIARETVFIDSDLNPSKSGPASSASRRYTVIITLQPKRGTRARASVVNAALAEVHKASCPDQTPARSVASDLPPPRRY